MRKNEMKRKSNGFIAASTQHSKCSIQITNTKLCEMYICQIIWKCKWKSLSIEFWWSFSLSRFISACVTKCHIQQHEYKMLINVTIDFSGVEYFIGLARWARWAYAIFQLWQYLIFRIFYHSIRAFFCCCCCWWMRLIFMLEKFLCKYLCLIRNASNGLYLAHEHLLSYSQSHFFLCRIVITFRWNRKIGIGSVFFSQFITLSVSQFIWRVELNYSRLFCASWFMIIIVHTIFIFRFSNWSAIA